MKHTSDEPTRAARLRFGVFEFDPQTHELTKYAIRVKLQEQPDSGHDDRPIWIIRLPTGAARRAGELLATDAVWSPDGQYITYATGSPKPCRMRPARRYVLAEVNGATLSPAWPPDGRVVRFSVRETGPSPYWFLWDVNSDGTGLPRLTRVAAGEFFQPVIGRWMPDGRHYVFVAGSGGSRGRALPAGATREPITGSMLQAERNKKYVLSGAWRLPARSAPGSVSLRMQIRSSCAI